VEENQGGSVEPKNDTQRDEDLDEKDRDGARRGGTGDQADPVPPGGHDPDALEEAARKMTVKEVPDR
jgi:hypothetical protein